MSKFSFMASDNFGGACEILENPGMYSGTDILGAACEILFDTGFSSMSFPYSLWDALISTLSDARSFSSLLFVHEILTKVMNSTILKTPVATMFLCVFSCVGMRFSKKKKLCAGMSIL